MKGSGNKFNTITKFKPAFLKHLETVEISVPEITTNIYFLKLKFYVKLKKRLKRFKRIKIIKSKI
jgi:hypothetical protein